MRWLIGLLLVANLAMFAWWQGWLGGGVEPPPAEANAERLRVVPLDRLGGAPSRSVPPSTGSAVAPAVPAAQQSPAQGDAVPPAVAATCREYVLASEERARALRGALADSGARVELQRGEPPASYLVHLPPALSTAEAQRRVAELRRAGLEDVFLIQEGPLRLGVSVGVFSREEGARAVAARVSALGYEVRVAPRPPGAGGWKLTARWSDAGAAARGAAAAAPFGAEARDCPG